MNTEEIKSIEQPVEPEQKKPAKQKADKSISTRKKMKKKKALTHAILYIGAGLNNTIMTLTDLNGNAVTQVSAGTCGFKHCRKSTPHANQTIIKTMIDKAHSEYGVLYLKVVIKGPGPARDMLMFLQNNNISIESIEDVTSIAYNGVKGRRARRN